MKRRFLAALLSLSLLAGASICAQAPTPQSKEDEQLLVLVKEVQAQQAQIAENQKQIEAKLAEVAEALRVARIYSSRGG